MLKKKLLVGVGWMGGLRGATRVVDFLKIILLARLLVPADFGLFAIVTTTVTLLDAFTQTGLNFAVIHYKLKIQKVFKTLFFINMIRGILLSLFMIASAGILSMFYRSEELFGLILIASLIPFLKGIQNPSTVLFYQNLQFHKEFLFRIIPSIAGAFISIFLTFLFRSASGLVYGLVITTLLETAFSYVIEKHHFTSQFSFIHVKKVFSYTKWLTFSSGVSFLTNQVDNLFIGRFFNLSNLGIYDIGFKLASITYTEITDVISRVLFPTLSHIQKNKRSLKKYYLHTTLFLFIPATCATLIFMSFPDTLLRVAFGDQWVSASPILQILSIYGFIRTVNGPIGPLFLTLGKTKILSLTDITNFLLIVILIYPFSILWGINGVAWTIVVSYILVQPITGYHLYKFLRS